MFALASGACAVATSPGLLVGGRWATRGGPRPVGVAGSALFAASLAWVVVAAGERPDFVGVWLPYGLVGGVGIGLGLPALIGATASGLPAARMGMALATTARQLGVALLLGPAPVRAPVVAAQARTAAG